jgi:hypothetical protein
VSALDDLIAGVEQQESSSTISALGLSLGKALVPDQSTLLVTNKTTDRHSGERSRRDFTVDLGGGYDTGKARGTEVEELGEARVPLESLGVEEEGAGSVGDLSDVYALGDTAEEVIGDPGLDSAEQEIILIVRLGDLGVVVDHPSQLDGREVCGELETGPVAQDVSPLILDKSDNWTYVSRIASIPSWPFFHTPGAV